MPRDGPIGSHRTSVGAPVRGGALATRAPSGRRWSTRGARIAAGAALASCPGGRTRRAARPGRALVSRRPEAAAPRPGLGRSLLARRPPPRRWPWPTRRRVLRPRRRGAQRRRGPARPDLAGRRVSGGRNWSLALAGLGVVAAAGDPFVDPGRFAAVVVADDVRVCGMRHRFRTCGLGVPVVGTALRRPEPPDRDGRAVLPASAPDRGDRAGRARRRAGRRGLPAVAARPGLPRPVPGRLGLGRRACPAAGGRPHDPAGVAGVAGPVPAQAIRGLFATEFGPEVEPGLYMLRPYAPGKIPVVFVHGLASSPVAFLQAINDFQNDPVLSARYQFWVFIYPTGRTIVRSAQRLREALGRAEAAYGADPAFHRMVVVGHSMGGILAHMMVSDSGREVWDGALNVPPEGLRASPATRAAARPAPVLPPPAVRAPGRLHRHPAPGEPAGGRRGRPLLRRPDPAAGEEAARVAELEAWNGPGVIKDENFGGRVDQRDRQPPGRQPALAGRRPAAGGAGGAVPHDRLPVRRPRPQRPGRPALERPPGWGRVGGRLSGLSRLGAGPGRTG